MAMAALVIMLWIGFNPPRSAAQSVVRGPTRSPHGELAIACENCHTSTSWRPLRPAPDFTHLNTPYPLRGLHQKAACRSCHANLEFAKAGTRCADCHADIHMRKMGTACETCHSPRGWQASVQAQRDHQNRFPLLGAHAAAECASCHRGAAVGQYSGLATICASCHAKDYQTSKSLDHAAADIPMSCEGCHNMNTWHNVVFDHNARARFQLTGSHAALDCNACHTAGRFSGLSQDCIGCHQANYAGTKNPDHAAGGFSQDCATCHQTSTWKGGKFDHTSSRFPLTGRHTTAGCQNCHVGGTYTGTSSACSSCHSADYSNTRTPDHRTAGFSLDCSICHTPNQWKGAVFDHGNTRFQLSGAHTTVACQTCHAGNIYRGTSTACSSCHSADYGKTTSPDHTAAGFSLDCTLCHTTTQWKGAKFDHNATKFPLTNGHATAACLQCHATGTYRGTSTACAACHTADYNKTDNPNHVSAGFSQDCTLCHSTVQWKGARFDHGSTKFPLTGGHMTVACQQCHSSGIYRGTSPACASCHLSDFNKTSDPSHTSAGFSQDCTLCHTTAQWEGAKFDHSTTRFPLNGAHAPVACQKCHSTSVYRGTSPACASCHMEDYNRASDPNHVVAGFSQDCSLCHAPVQWKGATFNHGTTRFPLSGAHTSVTCQLCHSDGRYAGTPSTCVSCHQANFAGTTNPNHVAAGFPQDCTVCHTTVQWKGATFNHGTTRFPLSGAHTSLTCQVCHTNGKYAGTPSTCISCHQANFAGTTNPNHVSAGFSQDCTVCHTTVQWKGATFNHGTTRFPLSGAHASVTCQLCHTNGRYAGTPSTCISCHQANFAGTTNPNHVSAGFSQDCTVCHSTVQWKGATFNHGTTRFPLSGAHTSVTCQLCHTNGRYAGTPLTCVSCHQTNFTGATNPNHVTAGFPQDCTVCHTTVQWKGATFNHGTTRFPLSGAHASAACQLCHSNGTYAGTPSTCVSCHQANFTGTTNPNHVAAGFSQECTLCHTTVQWKGATFNHGTTRFPLSGAHTSVACQLCHSNGTYAGTPSTCVSCHQANYTGTTNPNHVTAGFPQDCTLCHTTVQWKGATFNHSTTRFLLTGAHVSAQCVLCHVNGRYAGTPTNCAGCHLADYSKTTNPNHTAAAFPQDCSLCHATNAWAGAQYNHSTTRFPLTGAHTSLQCIGCHASGQFATLPTTCVSCHLSRYTGTTNPNHTTAGFPQDCTVCHTTTAWRPASFNHGTTRFPLTGAHTTVACVSCHIAGVYAGTPSACYSCHQSRYTSVTDPNHVAAGFPTTCATCHTTTSWSGATFTHKFPITSGNHANNTCSVCHPNSANYTVFSCLGCHQHDKTSMDSQHRSVNNYVYNSTNCYSCHPNGRS